MSEHVYQLEVPPGSHAAAYFRASCSCREWTYERMVERHGSLSEQEARAAWERHWSAAHTQH